MNQMRLWERREREREREREEGGKNFRVIGFNLIRKRFFARALACPRSTLLKIAIEYAKRKLPKGRLIRSTWLKVEGTKKKENVKGARR